MTSLTPVATVLVSSSERNAKRRWEGGGSASGDVPHHSRHQSLTSEALVPSNRLATPPKIELYITPPVQRLRPVGVTRSRLRK